MVQIKNIRKTGIRLYRALRGKDFLIFRDTSRPRQTFGNPGADWTFCPDVLNQHSIVYSVGIGKDISFDLALIKAYGLNNYFAFDPTPDSIEWLKHQDLPSAFKAFQYGLADKTQECDFFLPDNQDFVSASIVPSGNVNRSVRVTLKSLPDIMSELGHTHIDVLKMDIEGAEYDVIEQITQLNISIKQLLIEFHHRLPGIQSGKTKDAIRQLRKSGFKIFNISLLGEEYSFIKA